METLGVRFDEHQFPARKDLIDLVVEKIDKQALKKIGQSPERWTEEFELLWGMFSKNGLVPFQDFTGGPPQDQHLHQLGSNSYRYLGPQTRYRGFWLTSESASFDVKKGETIPCTVWTRYSLGTNARLLINSDFADITPEGLLPENFEARATKVKDNKRPILTFSINAGDNHQITIFAKGTEFSLSFLYDPPSYRLTPLAGAIKRGSEVELQTTIRLAQAGVKVPAVVGLYKAMFEEYLFVQKVEGDNPIRFLDTHRQVIIEQDAQLLATLCLLGYHKGYFADFDDKLFDGKNLYLIDVDELGDLYYPGQIDYRQMLLDPNNQTLLREFRRLQRSRFRLSLRNALYDYRNTLLQNPQDQERYIKAFSKAIGWSIPTPKQIREITVFDDDYLTHDTYMSVMSDTE